MIRLIIPVALFLATPSLAQTYSRADIVRGLCEPDGCHEFALVQADEIAVDEEGRLLRTRLRTFHASQAGRRDLGEEDGFVYCSPTRPAILADQDGRTMAFFLAPSGTGDSRETTRRNGNYHAVYFAICHGLEAGRAAVQNLSGVAQSLGYRVSLDRSKMATLSHPEDVVARQGRGRAEPRPLQSALSPPRDVPLAEPKPVPLNRPAEPLAGGGVPRRSPPPAMEPTESWLDGPRRLTNQAFDSLDRIGSWVLGW